MIPQCAHEHSPAIGDFSSHNGAGDFSRHAVVVSPAILLAPKKHIAGNRPVDARPELAVLAQERESYVSLATQVHERRATRDLSEAYDAAESVDGHAQFRFVFDTHEHGLAFAREVCALRGDEESVEKLFHSAFFSRRLQPHFTDSTD